MISITELLKSNIHYEKPQGQNPPPPQRKLPGAHLSHVCTIKHNLWRHTIQTGFQRASQYSNKAPHVHTSSVVYPLRILVGNRFYCLRFSGRSRKKVGTQPFPLHLPFSPFTIITILLSGNRIQRYLIQYTIQPNKAELHTLIVHLLHLTVLVTSCYVSCILTYLLTYSMQQSPSWEANWFCS